MNTFITYHILRKNAPAFAFFGKKMHCSRLRTVCAKDFGKFLLILYISFCPLDGYNDIMYRMAKFLCQNFCTTALARRPAAYSKNTQKEEESVL